jgi:AsmA protein
MLKRRTTVQDDLMAPPRRPGPRHARRRRVINPALVARGIGLMLALLVATYFGLPLLVRAGRFRPVLESTLRGVLGRPTRIRELRYSLRSRGLVALDLSVDEDPGFGRQPFLLAKTVNFDVGLLSLIFSSDPEITGITFDDAQISLKQDRAGNWNFYTMLGAADRAPSTTHPARLRLTHSSVSVTGPRADLDPLVLHDLALDIQDPALDRASRLALSATFVGGGSLNVDGTAGPVGWNRAAPTIPASLLINVRRLNLEASHLAETVPGVGGLVSFDVSAESDGAMVQVNGQVKAGKVRLARNGAAAADPLQATFSLRHDLAAHTGALSRCDLRVTKGFAGITGSYSSAPAGPLDLHFEVAVNAAPVTELDPLLPAAGYPLPGGISLQGGLVFANLKLEGPADHPITTGAVSVNNTRVNRFELADKLVAIDALNVHDLGRDVDLTLWSASVRLSPEGSTMENVRAAISNFGEMAGSGTIGNNGTLDFRMTGTRPRSSPVPFAIRGTCTDPVFRPAPRS